MAQRIAFARFGRITNVSSAATDRQVEVPRPDHGGNLAQTVVAAVVQNSAIAAGVRSHCHGHSAVSVVFCACPALLGGGVVGLA